MATLPVSTDLTGSSITEAQAKTWFTQLRDFLSGLLGTAGTVSTALAALQVPFGLGVEAKTGAYTVVAADRGKTFNCSGTWSLALTAAATLGNGFMVSLTNLGSGVITVDPSGTELIDGATTLDIPAGSSAVLVCTGTAWITVGRSLIVTPGYRHAAGASVYSRFDDAFTCYNYTSYESIPAWGDPGGLTNAVLVNATNYSYMSPFPHRWYRTTGVHADPAFMVDHAGTITVSFQMQRAVGSGTAYARVCKNGVEVQAWSQTSETYTTYSVNVDVKVGDLITIQRKSSSTTVKTTGTRYHRVLITQPT